MKQLYSFYFALSITAVISYPLFGGNILYMHRMLKMTIVPIILLIGYLYRNKHMPFTYLKWIVFVSIFGNYWSYAHYVL